MKSAFGGNGARPYVDRTARWVQPGVFRNALSSSRKRGPITTGRSIFTGRFPGMGPGSGSVWQGRPEFLRPRYLRVLNRLPYLLRSERRRQLRDAEFGERVHHAVGDAGRAADRTGLAAAFGAEWIGAAGR